MLETKYNLAVCYFYAGNTDEAINVLQSTIDENKTPLFVYENLMQMLHKAGRTEELKNLAYKVLNLFPQNQMATKFLHP